MSFKKNKLELTWIGKEHRPRLEPRILLEETGKSYHATHRATDRDLFDNRLIHGDNLLALKALEQDFVGKVKCIFIDPPYNTGSAFEHYDDGVEHSIWLSLMRERLEIIRRLLAADGSLWVTLDDNEAHYFKVMCDEVFGRKNFVANIVWQKRYAPDVRIAISDAHENLFCYAADSSAFSKAANLIPLAEAQTKQFKNPDNDLRGPWKASDFTAAGFRPNQMYDIKLPSGRIVKPPAGRCWRVTEEGFRRFSSEDRMYYGPKGDGVPALKRFLSEMEGMTPWTWWPHTEVGHSQEAKNESQALFERDNAFATPKPERLIQRVLQIATNPGDLVLDSFLGSGTTAAVAHKMGRPWIGIELGEHCHTHCLPRLKKVVDGTDPGGITGAAGWKGGGGFRYYRLAPSLLLRDKWDQLVINPQFNAHMLAAAVCKLEGFTYAPSDTLYWQQGHSSEQDFIYTTTTNLSHEQLQQLSDEVGPERSLLVVCSAFRGRKDGYSNLTVKKIPKAVLTRCEWGKDDYSLKVENLPQAPAKAGQQELNLL